MKRKQKLHVGVGIIVVLVIGIILFIFLKGGKKSLTPVSRDITPKSQSFLQEIGVDPQESDRHVIIANNQFVTTTGTMTFSPDKNENIFAFSNNDGDDTEILVLEQPQNATLVKGIKIGGNTNVGISLPLPGTYRFGLKNNPAASYTVTVVDNTSTSSN